MCVVAKTPAITMTTTKRPSSARRPILRLDLAAVSIDDRPNTYKDPQLVLKPHLVLTPRGSSTELKARAPYWKHFLMIHVRDKAEELVRAFPASLCTFADLLFRSNWILSLRLAPPPAWIKVFRRTPSAAHRPDAAWSSNT